jgi:hypothetical protein
MLPSSYHKGIKSKQISSIAPNIFASSREPELADVSLGKHVKMASLDCASAPAHPCFLRPPAAIATAKKFSHFQLSTSSGLPTHHFLHMLRHD